MAGELPALLIDPKGDLGSLALTGEGRTPLAGEVRRDSTVSLVAFPSPQDGRFIVGRVANDTIWVEMTTLSETASWRGDARAAFVRRRQALPQQGQPDAPVERAGGDEAGVGLRARRSWGGSECKEDDRRPAGERHYAASRNGTVSRMIRSVRMPRSSEMVVPANAIT